jgi:phage FluMu protein Com
MQPIQFQCGHCGKLMAVSSQHLGQQVRCPHCQQVVMPPSPAPTLPSPKTGEDRVEMGPVPAPPGSLPGTAPQKSPPDDAGADIFSPANPSDDIFSRGEMPRIEMPLESLPPTLPGDSSIPPQDPEATLSSTPPWAALHPAVEPNALLLPDVQIDKTAVHSEVEPLWPGGALSKPLQMSPTAAPFHPDGESSDAGARAAKRTEAKAPWFLLLVFCPLLLYSIVISIFAFLLYREHQQLRERLRNPFEMMPDVGDDPGVRKGKKVSFTDRYPREFPTLPLPESLCTTLGKPLRVGDLQVTPNRVERKRVSVVVESARPEVCKHDSLVLYLDLKNLSSEYAFAPLDNYFDRYWHPGLEDPIPPLTLLEVGRNRYRFYGGPANWNRRGDANNLREWVKGRRDQADLLQPGEEKQMFVCTDGNDDKAAAVLFGEQPGQEYQGRFLWRVRVRRGLVHIQDKDYSATAVIGVRFNDSDIFQPGPGVQ